MQLRKLISWDLLWQQASRIHLRWGLWMNSIFVFHISYYRYFYSIFKRMYKIYFVSRPWNHENLRTDTDRSLFFIISKFTLQLPIHNSFSNYRIKYTKSDNSFDTTSVSPLGLLLLFITDARAVVVYLAKYIRWTIMRHAVLVSVLKTKSRSTRHG